MHDVPRFLYKYLNIKSFKLIAESYKLQWSRAVAFNDPFDFQVDPQIGVSIKQARLFIATRIARLTLHPDEWVHDNNYWSWHKTLPVFFPDFNITTDIYSIIRPTILGMQLHTAAQIILNEHSSIVDDVLNFVYAHVNHVIKHKLEDFHYILCLSEIYDSILMWSHYGENHTGVVLEIDTTVPGKNFYRSSLKKVEYSDQIPAFFEHKFIRYYMTGEISFDMRDTYERSTYTKSAAWSYEREWRIISGLHPDGVLLRGLLRFPWPFFPENITGVYLGSRATDEDRQSIISICRTRFPYATIWKGHRPTDRFVIEFDQFA